MQHIGGGVARRQRGGVYVVCHRDAPLVMLAGRAARWLSKNEAVPLSAHGDVANAAADGLLHIGHIVTGGLG